MTKGLYKKGLVFGIILLFIGASVVPCISGNTEKISPVSSVEINDEVSLTDNIRVPDCVEAGDILMLDVGGWDE